ncbi:CERS5-like protein [Mya arenaria]|uniref:CERS5-like protein n=1 Tax=Mya arenaria TaxID=6604 RepID=A0ABY7DCG3_MYAAR|nr:CERS5-like protein [Mya arenaria]
MLILPLGYKLGIKKKKLVYVDAIPSLEAVYKTKKKPDDKQCMGLSKQLDMPLRQVQVWFRNKRNNDLTPPIKKFCDNAWSFLFYTCSFIYGATILWNKSWIWRTKDCWTNWPKQGLSKQLDMPLRQVQVWFRNKRNNDLTPPIKKFCDNAKAPVTQHEACGNKEAGSNAVSVDIQEDTWIFLIATLLCNVLVYNTKGVFDASHISKFRFLKVVHSNMTVAKGASEDDSFLDFFLPNLVLVLRDFGLESDISKEVFLEKQLMYKKGKSDIVNEFNEPRRLIRRYFKRRTCFDIPIPCTRPDQLESMPDSKIESEFLQQINDLHQYLCKCSPKKLISGKPSMMERNSLERSRKSIEILDMEIQRKIKEKKYAHAHGYNEYIKDIDTLADEFTKQESYHGSKTRAALQEYMDSKVDEEQQVYEMVKDKTDDEVHRQLLRLPRT